MKSRITTLLVLFLTIPQLFAETSTTTSEAYKDTYHFFVGIDLRIAHEDNFYPLLDISQNKALIKVDGETISKPIRKLENFQVKKGTKFSKNFIEVEELSCTPAYSIDADPELRAMQNTMIMNAMTMEANDQFDKATRAVQQIEGRMRSGELDLEADLSQAQSTLDSATVRMHHFPTQTIKDSSKMNQYDVLKVSIKVKASRPMEHPFLVMVAKLKDTEDGEVTASWMHFRALGAIPTFPSTIDFTESSFPDGKFVDSVEVFFFSGGGEIATSQSPKRVDLTIEQVRNFANFQYTTQNLSKTLPPTPAWYVLDPSLFRNVDPKLMNATLGLTIDKDGMVTQVSTDAEVDQYAIATLRDTIQELFFYPALDKGNPVSGKLQIKLHDYLL